jgi:hypothetical protein
MIFSSHVRAHAKINFLTLPLQSWLCLDNLIIFGNDANGNVNIDNAVFDRRRTILNGGFVSRFVVNVVHWEEVISSLVDSQKILCRDDRSRAFTYPLASGL